MRPELAIVVPVRDGGRYLHASVDSIGAASLAPGRAEVLVLDNCSGDGAPAALPAFTGDVPVRVIQNERDLGRVGNWNRGIAIARERGFAYATFLFAGDTWIPGSAGERLLDLMRRSGACLGLAPYLTVDESGRILRRSARVSFRGASKVVPAADLLAAMAGRGHLPVTPLQANIYRIAERFPVFDEGRPLTTDMDATLEFLASTAASVALTADPFCAWLARKGRVFCSSGLEAFMADHFRQLRRAEEIAGRPVDWTSAKSLFLIGYIRNGLTFAGLAALPGVVRSAMRHAAAEPGRVDPFDITRLLLAKALAGRSSLHLS